MTACGRTLSATRRISPRLSRGSATGTPMLRVSRCSHEPTRAAGVHRAAHVQSAMVLLADRPTIVSSPPGPSISGDCLQCFAQRQVMKTRNPRRQRFVRPQPAAAPAVPRHNPHPGHGRGAAPRCRSARVVGAVVVPVIIHRPLSLPHLNRDAASTRSRHQQRSAPAGMSRGPAPSWRCFFPVTAFSVSQARASIGATTSRLVGLCLIQACGVVTALVLRRWASGSPD